MVRLKLHWSREHLIDFSKQVYSMLLKDRLSDTFDITLHMDSCSITIDDGEISE